MTFDFKILRHDCEFGLFFDFIREYETLFLQFFDNVDS
jgi:hypothetical protein